MRPTPRQLEYIIAIAEMGQISLAAAKLNVSQPSLSAQLAEVEADLGVSLFHRSRSGVRITPVGEEILRRARQIVHDIHDLRAVVQGGGLFQGRLRLGVLPSIGPYLLPSVIQKLHREHPSLRLMAAAGTGLAILPNIYAVTEASRGLGVHIARIDDPLAVRTISLLQLATKVSNSESEILVQALRDGAKSLIQGL